MGLWSAVACAGHLTQLQPQLGQWSRHHLHAILLARASPRVSLNPGAGSRLHLWVGRAAESMQGVRVGEGEELRPFCNMSTSQVAVSKLCSCRVGSKQQLSLQTPTKERPPRGKCGAAASGATGSGTGLSPRPAQVLFRHSQPSPQTWTGRAGGVPALAHQSVSKPSWSTY